MAVAPAASVALNVPEMGANRDWIAVEAAESRLEAEKDPTVVLTD
jgi:hypothetical protein